MSFIPYTDGVEVETPTGVQSAASGTITVRLTDPENHVAGVGFEVSVTQPDGTVRTSGPYGLDAPPVVSEGIASYSKEVLLDRTGRTEIAPVIELDTASPSIRPAPVSFGPRGTDQTLALLNFREVERTATEIVYRWSRGAEVGEVWVHDALHAQPVPADPWPAEGAAPAAILITEDEYRVSVPPRGSVRYLQVEPRAEPLAVGPVQRVIVFPIDASPVFEHVSQLPGSSSALSDLFVRIRDPQGLGGTLTVWSNRVGEDDADPALSPDGALAVPSTPATVGAADLTALDGVQVHPGRGKRVFLEFVNSEGVSTGVRSELLHGWSTLVTLADELRDAAVTRQKILDGAVDDLKLANAAVTNAKLALGAVNTANIVDGAIAEVKLAAQAVTTAKLAVGAVTGQVLAAQAVTTAKLAVAAVTADVLAASAVTETKIGDGAISAGKLQAGSVVAGKIGAGAVTANEIAATAVTAAKLDAGAVTAEKIAALAVTAGKIEAGAVTAEKIQAGAVVAEKLAAGAVVAGKISASAIDATTLFSGRVITSELIALNAITGDLIATGTITADQIHANAITAGKINAGAVTADKISSIDINVLRATVNSLSALTVDAGQITAGQLRNAVNSVGVAISGGPDGSWTNYLNLSGSGNFLYASAGGVRKFSVDYGGNAYFAGELEAASGTFHGQVKIFDSVGNDLKFFDSGNNEIAALDAFVVSGRAGLVIRVDNQDALTVTRWQSTGQRYIQTHGSLRAQGGFIHGPGGELGFFGAAGITSQPSVGGSRSGGAALQNLLTTLGNLGLIWNATSP